MKETRIFEQVFGSEDRREIQLFRNEELDLQMRTVLNEDGSISVNAEDTAIGFGWVTVAKSGNEVIRWQRFNDYVNQLGFSPQVKKETYIPESLYYLLAMKANNRRAQKFQKWLAMEVIPEIRKTGTYNTAPIQQTAAGQAVQENYEVFLEAARIIATIPNSQTYVINCLRHVVPDIDNAEIQEKTAPKAEVATAQKNRPVFYKQGVDLDIKKLALTMAQRNISKQELAARTQVCMSTLEGWIRGYHKPVLQNRINLCVALGENENFLTPRRTRRTK